MNLTLSYRGDYVVRAAIYLSSVWRTVEYSKLRHIAETMRLPVSYTPQILGMLARAGLVESRAGRGGGYRLARSPAEISLREVVEAAEVRLKVERCPIRGTPCTPDDGCMLHPAWMRAATAVQEALGTTMLADLVGDGSRVAGAL